MGRRTPCEKNSCLWLENKGMASEAEFCPPCREINHYSPSYVVSNGIATKGVCQRLHHPPIQSDPQSTHQGSTRTNRRYPARASRGVSNRFIAEPAKGSKMGTATNPSQSNVDIRRIQKRFHSALNAMKANSLARNQRTDLEVMEFIASAGDPTYKGNIKVPKGGISAAAVSQRQFLDDVLSGASRICGG
jgi:hypothetical protein